MAGYDVAGVVGTWIAAFFAVVALLGVIGPVLVWRASRTERHKALAAVGNDSHGFISRGIHAGPNIWLLQRVRAPILDSAPRSIDGSFVVDADVVNEASSPSTWVNFGILLKAYGVKSSTGDKLVIRNARALLPVHRFWLLAVGLKGRYSERKDRGKLGGSSRVVRLATPRRAQRYTHTPIDSNDYTEYEYPPQEYPRSNSRTNNDYNPDMEFETTLYGVTGCLSARLRSQDDDISILSFRLAPQPDIRRVEPDSLLLKELFMLASGCMPLQGGSYFSLTETSFEDNPESSNDSDEHVEIQRPAVTSGHSRTRPRMKSHHTGGLYESPQRRQSYLANALFNAYQLFPASERDSALREMARPFGADEEDVQILAPVRSNGSLASRFRKYDGMTYIPAEHEWVCLQEDSRNPRLYINRADAQVMAHSLLDIPWHPESYLLGAPFYAIGTRLLTFSASRLVLIASRVSEGIDKLGLGDSEESRLREALEPAIRRLDKQAPPDRTTTALCYRLDLILNELGQRGERRIIDTMIGILMITNQEYQELFYQSLRHLQQTTTSTIQVDMRAGTIKIPSAFGVLQTFILDLDRVIRGQTRSHDSVNVPYSATVLASLRGCLRSQMLRDCFNADPLMGLIQNCGDIVHLQ